MIYTVTNRGSSRDIFYKGTMYYIPRHGTLDTTDRNLALVAAKFPFISFNDVSTLRRVKKLIIKKVKQKKELNKK